MITRYKIIGPPGTGKTYRLVNNYLKKEIQSGTPHENILYVGFSNATVDEARSRINKVFPGNKIVIKTLHSFGKSYLKENFSDHTLLVDDEWNHFKSVKKWKISFANKRDADTGYTTFQSWQMKVIEYARSKMWGIDKLRNAIFELGYQNRAQNSALLQVSQLMADIDQYKIDYKRYEFSDMIKKFVEEECSPSLECIFLDEAQDLNPLEWSMIRYLENLDCVTRSYVAGDDDQAIYAFKGGEASTFINLEGIEDPQIKSNRVPRSVHREAQLVLNTIEDRLPKTWEPREEEGEVIRGQNLEDINFDEKEWLILTRNNDLHESIVGYLEFDKQYVEHSKMKILTTKVLKGFRIFDRLKKGEAESIENILYLYRNFCTAETKDKKGQLKRKDKKQEYGYKDPKRFEAHDYLTLSELQQDHGLLINDWKELNFTNTDAIQYIESLLERNVDLHKPSRIRISTIHSIKGGEGDNVILFTDMTSFVWEQVSKRSSTRDTEHRVWYVAITRAKHTLYYMQHNINNPFQYVPGRNFL